MDTAPQADAPLFSVVIVNFNGGAHVQTAVASLAVQTRRDFELIIIDNGSTDGSFDALNVSGVPDVTAIPANANLGFAMGNNKAAARARGTWLVLLNPDAVAEPDWLDEIAAGIARHPGVTMFACTQIDSEDPRRLDGAGDAYFGFGIPWRGGFGRPIDELPGEGTCFSPCGASAVFRRDVFLSHGGFDERMFCYCEDVDLGFRLRLAGHRCVFLDRARVAHTGSAIAGRQSAFAVYHGTRNRLWTYVKNMPLSLLILTLPGHVAISLYLLARAHAIGRFGATWRGLVDSLLGLGPVLADRRSGAARRRAGLGELAAAMSWNPFRLRGRRPDVRPLKASPARETAERRLV